MLATLGLILILIGWLIQLYFVWKGDRSIQPLLLLCYGAGVAILIIDGLAAGMTVGALLNLAVVVIVIGVGVRIIRG